MIRGVWARGQSLSRGPALSTSLPSWPWFPTCEVFPGPQGHPGWKDSWGPCILGPVTSQPSGEGHHRILLGTCCVPSPEFTTAVIQVPGGAVFWAGGRLAVHKQAHTVLTGGF